MSESLPPTPPRPLYRWVPVCPDHEAIETCPVCPDHEAIETCPVCALAGARGGQMKGDICFRPIPGINSGHTALTISPPGAWFDSPYYHVFVGGGGVGEARSLKAAKEILFEKAKAECAYRLAEARKAEAHWIKQLSRLEKAGLEGAPQEREGETR